MNPRFLLIFLLMFCSSWVCAQDSIDAHRKAFVFQLGFLLSSGGDELVEVDLEGPISDSSSSVKTGDGVGLSLGIGSFVTRELEFRASIGIHRDGLTASNGKTSFNRYPLEGVVLYHMGRHAIGIGASYLLKPEFKFEIEQFFREDIKFKSSFENSLGFMVQYEYALRKDGKIGLRYLSTEFEDKDNDLTFDGSYVAIVAGYTF